METKNCEGCSTPLASGKVCSDCKRSRKNQRTRERYWQDIETTRKRGRDKARSRTTLLRGITQEEYQSLVEASGSRCNICGTNEPSGMGRWVVDHDHDHCPGRKSCKDCIRGILCSRCNTGLGMFKDNLSSVEHAASYLKAHEIYNPPFYKQKANA